jgi:hypothetical protein
VGGGLLLVNIPESFKSRFRQPISEEVGQCRVQVTRSEFSLHRTRKAHFLNFFNWFTAETVWKNYVTRVNVVFLNLTGELALYKGMGSGRAGATASPLTLHPFS